VRRELTESLDELRELARGIHPAVLSGHGLAVALESVAARAPVPVKLDVTLDDRVPEAVEVAAYYLVAESLTNVAKYAEASSATVAVTRVDRELVVEVADDGVGGADSEAGSGLRGLADRVEALDGRLRIWSPQGGGTRVRAEIPCG
jgi:signal transduction histidine kinase